MTKTDTTALLRQLAEKMGLPLSDLVANGTLPNQIAAQMDKNCTACPDPATCKAFLTQNPGTIERAPSFCVNGRLLTFLGKTLPKQP